MQRRVRFKAQVIIDRKAYTTQTSSSWGGIVSCFPENEHLWPPGCWSCPPSMWQSRLPPMDVLGGPRGCPHLEPLLFTVTTWN